MPEDFLHLFDKVAIRVIFIMLPVAHPPPFAILPALLLQLLDRSRMAA